MRKEICLLNNKLRDSEFENSKLKDNIQHFDNYMNQSSKIDDLERENRKLKSDVDYLK